MNGFGQGAVLLGGNSVEREVSFRSGNAILTDLLRQGIDAITFDPKVDELVDLKKKSIDRVFIVLHRRGDEDVTMQGFLTTLNILFTGSDVSSSAVAMDKSKTKRIWQSVNLPTAEYQIIIQDDFDQRQAKDILAFLACQAIVNPVNEGSRIGMAKVENAEQLVHALSIAFEFDNKVLSEIHMQTNHTFYDYEAKYQFGDTQYYCPCGLEQSVRAELNELSEKAFEVIGCRGWGRIDA